MTAAPQTDPKFAFVGLPEIEEPEAIRALAEPPDQLGPLAQLVGGGKTATWTGHGFDTIWRPNPIAGTGQDRFLELNLTTETLVFTRLDGKIPNRGLLMPDINMFGITYMQEISERNTDPPQGLHIEPGIWANVPHTTNPAEPPTVVRMGSIPHGTAILAQGTGKSITGGPHIGANNIIPTHFRFASPGVTEAMVRNPNSVLEQAIAGQGITSTTVLSITTKHTPVAGGGTANTAFLEAASFPPGGNAKAVEVDAIFWIESVAGSEGEPDTLSMREVTRRTGKGNGHVPR